MHVFALCIILLSVRGTSTYDPPTDPYLLYNWFVQLVSGGDMYKFLDHYVKTFKPASKAPQSDNAPTASAKLANSQSTESKVTAAPTDVTTLVIIRDKDEPITDQQTTVPPSDKVGDNGIPIVILDGKDSDLETGQLVDLKTTTENLQIVRDTFEEKSVSGDSGSTTTSGLLVIKATKLRDVLLKGKR